jgi:ABC-type enterobactin transport system permease subunit
MKVLVQFLGALVVGGLSAVLLSFLDVDLTTTQFTIIIVGITVIASIVEGVAIAINKQIDRKKYIK